MITSTDTTKARRLELILRQIDSLPTLPVVATRLLALTASDESNARQVIDLVRSDPAITAKILALCRHAELGIRDDVLTIDRAVVLLGFNAVRNAVLSIKVFETFNADHAGAGAGRRPAGAKESLESLAEGEEVRFDRRGFWRHSLAVALVAEMLAAAHPGQRDLPPAEAFVCGLLHDIGKLALDHVLPKSFWRIIELSELNRGNIAEFERRVVGLDHHTAGKRLAEQWQLPHRLQDCIWLHGSAYDTLPRLEHRRLIGLVRLADLLVRRQHIGYSGNFVLKDDPAHLAHELGLKPGCTDHAVEKLHEELEHRARALGLDETPSRELFLQSIQQANQTLGKLNGALERRTRTATRQAQVLDAVTAFHARATPGRSVQDVLHTVVASAAHVLGAGFYAMLMQPEDVHSAGKAWMVGQYDAQGEHLRSQIVEPPPHAVDLSRLDPREPVSMNLMSILPWIADYLMDAPDMREVRLLPLSCGWGTAAVLLHDRATPPPWQQLAALTSTWGAAIAAAAQHDGARRLGEDLAEANRALAEAQDRLLQNESMARLGEMAAGAAHEMNNPLAVISGRSQLLTRNLDPGSKEHKAAQTIWEQSHRLSDMITALRTFADPPKPVRRPTEVSLLLDEVVKRVQQTHGQKETLPQISLTIKRGLPAVSLDPEQMAQAITELILNAVQAQPKTWVTVLAQVEPIERQLVIGVSDDGAGMDEHTLAHAMDPFFSAKAAGRRVGMGLPRAQQIVQGHGGHIDLRSTPGTGTRATLRIPLDSPC